MPEVDPALVHQAIKELPAKGRTVLVLRALEGYSHKEIAETLGSEGLVDGSLGALEDHCCEDLDRNVVDVRGVGAADGIGGPEEPSGVPREGEDVPVGAADLVHV